MEKPVHRNLSEHDPEGFCQPTIRRALLAVIATQPVCACTLTQSVVCRSDQRTLRSSSASESLTDDERDGILFIDSGKTFGKEPVGSLHGRQEVLPLLSVLLSTPGRKTIGR